VPPEAFGKILNSFSYFGSSLSSAKSIVEICEACRLFHTEFLGDTVIKRRIPQPEAPDYAKDHNAGCHAY
jgi:hypothetical protein